MAEENKNIQMRLKSINEVDFKMSPGKIGADVDTEAVNIGFSSQIQPNTDNDSIAILFGVRFELDGEEVLESIYRFEFDVLDIKQFITINKDDSITISHIMPHLLSVAVGTMRGILVVKTADTNLAKFRLPMIDINLLNNLLSGNK